MIRCDRAKAAFHLPVLLLPLAWSTLGGTARAQVTPAAGAATGTAPTGTTTAGTATAGSTTAGATATSGTMAGLVPGVGEIRLDGTVRVVNAAFGGIILEVTSFTLATGKPSELSTPKPRTVLVSDQTAVHHQGATRRLALTDLKPGAKVMVVGPDVGAGKDFPAREIAVTDPTTASATGEVTGNGQGSSGGATGSGGSGNLSMGQTGDLLAAKMEFAQQIAALRAEMMREMQKMKAAGGTPPTQPAGEQPAGGQPNNQNSITGAQLNTIIAALRGEFADEIARLRTDVNVLKANAAPPAPAPAAEPEPPDLPPPPVEPLPADPPPAEPPPAEEAPLEPPAEEAPVEGEPAEPPAEEAPAEEAPVEEAPAEEAPAADDGAAADDQPPA